METEKQVEQFLKFIVEQRGGMCYKFMSPGRANVVDRICAMPGGVTVWVECKGGRGTVRPAQRREIQRLRQRDHHAFVVSSREEVRVLMKFLDVTYGEKMKWPKDTDETKREGTD